MELLQLKYFEAVAKCENMTLAAKQLCVAQPAISQSISRLEGELGVQLFTRIGKRIKLNPCGYLLLNRLPSILNAVENLKLELSDMADSPRQHICLNVLSASTLLPRLLSAFKQEYPTISFNLIQNIKATDYDLCISSVPSISIHKQGTILMDEEILLAVPSTHSAANESSISLENLEEEDFISLSSETTFRSITDFYCKNAGFNPCIIFESDNPSIVRGLIGAGLGVAFWPEISWGLLNDDSVKALHIENLNCRRTLYISPYEGKQLSNTAQLFHNFTLEFFSNLKR